MTDYDQDVTDFVAMIKQAVEDDNTKDWNNVIEMIEYYDTHDRTPSFEEHERMHIFDTLDAWARETGRMKRDGTMPKLWVIVVIGEIGGVDEIYGPFPDESVAYRWANADGGIDRSVHWFSKRMRSVA